MKLPELNAAIKSKCDAVNAIFDAHPDAMPDDKKQEIIGLNKEIEDMEISAKSLSEQDALKRANDARLAYLAEPQRLLPGYVPESSGDRRATAIKSAGERFTDDKAFKAWYDSIAPSGQVNEKVRVTSPSVSLEGLSIKTLVTGLSATSGGALVWPDFLGVQDRGAYQRPLTIRDLVTNGQTGGDTVEYVREGTPTNAAAPVAEATASSGSSGTKPESAYVLARITETVKTIAHWIPITRRALADAAQLRTMIDEFLRYGLEEELEDQMLTGDGTGENFTGIVNVVGTQSQAYTTDLLTTTRKARTKVRIGGRAVPNAYVMHPNDWEAFDLLQDNELRYYFGGPSVLGTPRLWGLPVVESEGMTQGASIVADWRRAVLWDRQQAAMMMTDSHSDYFIRNLIAVLAELRAAFGVIRPAAFVNIDLTP